MTERSFWAIISCGLCVALVKLGGMYKSSVEENRRMALYVRETLVAQAETVEYARDVYHTALAALQKGQPKSVRAGVVRKIKNGRK